MWWIEKQKELLGISGKHENLIVYDSESIINSINTIKSQSAFSKVFYAMKANFNPELLKLISKHGVGFECVSPGEVKYLKKVLPKISSKDILFTPNFAPKKDYIWALQNNLLVTIDNLYLLKFWPEIFKGKKILIRIDPGEGEGHHKFVKTAGNISKFGVPVDEINKIKKYTEKFDIEVIGLHIHKGSGVKNVSNWVDSAKLLINIAQSFPSIKIINLGGGLPIREKIHDQMFDIKKVNDLLINCMNKYEGYEFWIEPGRYIVGESGVILSHVTQTKEKNGYYYVGIGVGMNTLIRPALYDAYHEIVNLSQLEQRNTKKITIVGPICESSDTLGHDREFPLTKENDVILIANAGAYVRSMSSNYNLREIPYELII